MDWPKFLREYSERLPAPAGFKLHDGLDESGSSRTFFKSEDGENEIVVTVEVRAL